MEGSKGRLISFEKRAKAVEFINQMRSQGVRKSKACELLGINLRTKERWDQPDGLNDKRKGAPRLPTNKLTSEEYNQLLSTANSKTYQNLSPNKIVPMLADKGVFIASESTFYRILRAEKQLAHRQTTRPAKHHRPAALVAHAPNQVWSWDITYIPTQVRGRYFYLYMMIDIFSRKIVGWNIHELESSECAARLARQACLDEKIKPKQIVLHSDNGVPMKGATMRATLEKLGVIPSYSRPSVSDDNPYSEALFKTLKYHHSFPIKTRFEAMTDASGWCEHFVEWYNNEHLHSALKYVTPKQRHTGQDIAILEQRKQVYQLAKQKNPVRWSKCVRNWSPIAFVMLNPDKKRKSIAGDRKSLN